MDENESVAFHQIALNIKIIRQMRIFTKTKNYGMILLSLSHGPNEYKIIQNGVN